eukprot:TRINITY_DN1295_c0_g1_i7.p2 TRINITY_DN1295_c0_g1~~TRINITY_DN1295_c0_g1_i7.p2  ORF type:complete len:293 (+),score=47.19 TRINITY_DN1295_c0_g1_i7:55-933(+)
MEVNNLLELIHLQDMKNQQLLVENDALKNELESVFLKARMTISTYEEEISKINEKNQELERKLTEYDEKLNTANRQIIEEQITKDENDALYHANMEKLTNEYKENTKRESENLHNMFQLELDRKNQEFSRKSVQLEEDYKRSKSRLDEEYRKNKEAAELMHLNKSKELEMEYKRLFEQKEEEVRNFMQRQERKLVELDRFFHSQVEKIESRARVVFPPDIVSFNHNTFEEQCKRIKELEDENHKIKQELQEAKENLKAEKEEHRKSKKEVRTLKTEREFTESNYLFLYFCCN